MRPALRRRPALRTANRIGPALRPALAAESTEPSEVACTTQARRATHQALQHFAEPHTLVVLERRSRWGYVGLVVRGATADFAKSAGEAERGGCHAMSQVVDIQSVFSLVRFESRVRFP